MAKRIDFNLEPHRPTLTNPKEKTEELFNLINEMDTQKIKQFSITSSINLNINEDKTGENLIHKVLKSSNLLKKEFHRLNVIKFLVQNGVNPDQPNSENQTPLHLACKNQYNLIVEYLMSLRVNGNFQDNNGLTPLHYALQGKIEQYEEPKEPKEFFQKPKSVDFEKKELILNLKKQIWDKIKEEPFLKLLSNTLNKSIFPDVNIKKITMDLSNKIVKEGLKTDTPANRKFLKENIEIIRNEIENIIKKKWSGFPSLNDLEIHEKTEDSFSIQGNDISPLKDVNIKRTIKKLATDSKNNIKTLCESVTVDDYDIDSIYLKKFGEFYNQFKNENEQSFLKHQDNSWTFQDNIANIKWNTFNESKMVTNSFDFADNIIDWEQLTFIGGSRDITINDENTMDNINKILKKETIEQRVYTILTLGIQFKGNHLDNNNNLINLPVGIEFDKVILAYNAIFNKPIESNHIDPDGNVERINFFDDWKYKINSNSKNLASILYCMYSAYSCLQSGDNLTGTISNLFCAIIHAISTNEKLTNETLDNAFKKYRITDIIMSKQSINDKLIGVIKILLSQDLPEINEKINRLINIQIDQIEERTTLINDIIKDIVNKIKIMPMKPFHTDFLDVVTLLNGFEDVDNSYIPFNRNYINKIFNYNGEDDKLNRIIYIIKKKQSIHHFPIINQYLETMYETMYERGIFNTNNQALGKLMEARHLGLYFLGLIPTLSNFNNDIDFQKGILHLIEQVPPIHTFDNDNDLTERQIPLIGNYIYINQNMNNEQKYNYFQYNPIKCRPPTEFAIQLLKERNQNYYTRILKHILHEHKYNLNKIMDDNKELAKAFTYIYPIISVLAEFLEIYNSEHVNTIEKIIQELNKYNGYVLLYYFLLSPERLVKIPKFNYYEIPSLKKTGKFLYFDSDNEINLDIDPPRVINEREKTNINDQQSSVIYNQGITNYRTFMTNIIQNILKGKYIIRKEALIFSKEQEIPPSIAPILGEFYKYNVKQIILKMLNDIDADIFNNTKEIIKEIDISDKLVTQYLIIGKLTEEVVKEQVTNYIHKQIYTILEEENKINTGFLDLIIKPTEFAILFNSHLIDNIKKDNKEKMSFYQFSKVFNDKSGDIEEFIIYPEEYATTEILKSKCVLKINYKLYEMLLDNDINPFIIDNNDQSPIFPVLKLHMNEVIGNLKKRIDYREYSEINVIDFLKNECNNHLAKLTNNKDKFMDWIDYFVSYQKYEVSTLILSNDKYGNNIPAHLEDSFNVISYITNQYISESIYKIEELSKLDEIRSFFFKDNFKPFNKYLFINENFNNINNLYDTDEDNNISDLIENKRKEKQKLENNLNKLSTGKTKSKLEKIIQEITNEITALNIILRRVHFTPKNLDNTKIIKRYQLLTDNVGTLTKILSEMCKLENLNNSIDLLTFKFHGLEKVVINDILSVTDINLKLLDTLSSFYNHTNKISEMYFTFGKYTENNKVLEFTKELLIFINKHFIIFPYIMAIKKILFEYFKNMYPNSSITDINKRINYCFQNKLLVGDKENYIEDLLYNETNTKIIENVTNIFENSEKESQFNMQTVKEILDNVTNLFTINPIVQIQEDSVFYRQIKEVNNYFDSFTNRTILNWHAVIENTFKFNINQGRIINSIHSVIKPVSQ